MNRKPLDDYFVLNAPQTGNGRASISLTSKFHVFHIFLWRGANSALDSGKLFGSAVRRSVETKKFDQIAEFDIVAHQFRK
jgi:hypothetical protein